MHRFHNKRLALAGLAVLLVAVTALAGQSTARAARAVDCPVGTLPLHADAAARASTQALAEAAAKYPGLKTKGATVVSAKPAATAGPRGKQVGLECGAKIRVRTVVVELRFPAWRRARASPRASSTSRASRTDTASGPSSTDDRLRGGGMTGLGLLERAQRGDRAALEQLCREEWPFVYRVVAARVTGRQEAEDLTQEVFLRALRRLDGYQPGSGSFRPYLLVVAQNLLRDRWRSRLRVAWSDADVDSLETGERGPEDAAVAAEERAELIGRSRACRPRTSPSSACASSKAGRPARSHAR